MTDKSEKTLKKVLIIGSLSVFCLFAALLAAYTLSDEEEPPVAGFEIEAQSTVLSIAESTEPLDLLWEDMNGNGIWFYHDDVIGASCWVYRGAWGRGGISCIRDNQIQRHR